MYVVCVAVILLEGGTEFDLKTLDQASAEGQQMNRLAFYWIYLFFRSTLKSLPNKVGLRCLSARLSVRPQKVFPIPMKFGM